jgi:hypothetical protein
MAEGSRGKEFWAQHINALRSSGQTSVAYAREHSLSVQALGWWRRKLHPSLPRKSARAVAMRKSSRFVELKVSEAIVPRPMEVTVVLAGDVRLQMTDLPSPAWLVEVSQAMRGAR